MTSTVRANKDYATTSNDMVLLFEAQNDEAKHGDKIEFITLLHPKFLSPTVYILQNDSLFLELQSSTFRRFNSWFINQRVSSNGSLSLGTKVDPRFLVLPYIEHAGNTKFSPIDQIVVMAEGCARMPLGNAKTWGLDKICDVKDLDDMGYFIRYSPEKTQSWLQGKVRSLFKLLAKKRTKKVKSSTTVSSFNNAQSSAITTLTDRVTGGSTVVVTKDDTILALQIIVEYINDKIVQPLIAHFNVNAGELLANKKHVEVKRKADWEEELEIEKETLAFTNSLGTKVSDAANIENTSNLAREAKRAKTAVAPPKGIKPSMIKGTKSITSFFNEAKS